MPGFNKGFRLPAGDGISDDDVASFSTKIEIFKSMKRTSRVEFHEMLGNLHLTGSLSGGVEKNICFQPSKLDHFLYILYAFLVLLSRMME